MPDEHLKVAVIGSRTFTDKVRLFKILDTNIEKIEMVVSGGAAGADSFAQEWCKERGMPCLIFYPRWYDENGLYDRGAGFKRNYLIVRESNLVLAFWDGVSKGTANSIEIAKQSGKRVKIIQFESKH